MSEDTNNNYRGSFTTDNTWVDAIDSGAVGGSGGAGSYIYLDVGTVGSDGGVPITPFQETNLDYRIGQDRYSYANDDKAIKVDKGSPSKARYAVFYAVNKDPVIFCRTKREMIKEVKKPLKRKEVDYKSIRIFALMGGARVVKKIKKKGEKNYGKQAIKKI